MADRKLTKYEESLVHAMLTAKSQRDAYKKSLYKSDKMTDEQIDVEACRILARPNVALRLEELQEQLREHAVEKCLLSAEDILNDILETRQTCKDNMLKTDSEGNQIVDGAALNGRNKANELLGKHLKLFTDKVESVNANFNKEMSEEEAERILKEAGIDV